MNPANTPSTPSFPLVSTDGTPEVRASWVAEHLPNLRLIDVREPHELTGTLGAIDGAENIPLLRVLGHCDELAAAGPLVLVCRSGRRSALAADALRRSGCDAVSVEGGMLAWNLVVRGREAVVEEERSANTHLLSDAIYRTNGLPEVSAQWVKEHIGHFRLIDVREPHELQQTGRVAQAENVPLGSLLQVADGWDREAPLVVMCASGNRSGRAAMAMVAAGFQAVASLEGGMFGWLGQRLPAVQVR